METAVKRAVSARIEKRVSYDPRNEINPKTGGKRVSKDSPWFKLYPSDFMNGVRGLTPQQVGLYTMLLCKMYEEASDIEYHQLKLATYCNMRPTSFQKTFDQLVELGKISVEDGMVKNSRAEKEISDRADKLKKLSKAGLKSSEKRQQKQGQRSTYVEQMLNQEEVDTDTDNTTLLGARKNDTNLEKVAQVIGVDISQISQGDLVDRWISDLDVTIDEILKIVSGIADRCLMQGKATPRAMSYYSQPIQEFAGRKSLKLSPTIPKQKTTPSPNGGVANVSMERIKKLAEQR